MMKGKFIAFSSTVVCLIAGAISMKAAQLQEARVTQVIKDVNLLPSEAAPRPAVMNDNVRGGTAIRTGVESRAELTFADQTLTRLGANTVFSFNQGTRELNLSDGAMLLQVPRNGAAAKIKTAAVTAAISGGTAVGESHPTTSANPNPISKWFCLEGVLDLVLRNGESVQLSPGQMVATDGTSFPKPLEFDIGKFTSTSLFYIGFSGTLANSDLTAQAEQKQDAQKAEGAVVPAGFNAAANQFDLTSLNTLDQNVAASSTSTSTPTATPTPTPTPPPTTVDVAYTGVPSGNWSDPASWNPMVIPNNGNMGQNYNASMSGGMLIQDIVAGVTIEQFQMSGGTLRLDNPLTVGGLFAWTAGTLAGGGVFNANGGISLNGGSQLHLDGATLNNAAGQTATDSGFHDFFVENGGIINNAGTWLAQNDLGLNFGNGGTFNNSGAFTRDTGTGTYTIGSLLPFNNSGTVNAQTGALAFNGGYTQTAGTLNVLSVVSSSTALAIQSGLVTGTGTINAAINNNGTIMPALGGSGLTVNGNVSLLAASNLSFQLGGITQGSQYGFMNVNGTVGLSGSLVLSFVNGFQTSPLLTSSTTFTVLSSTTPLTGAFANVASGARLTTSDNFGSFLVTYSGSNLVLSNYVPFGAAMEAFWTGGSGNWNVGANWSINPNFPQNGQPNSTDTYNATLANGGTITVNVPITIERFTLSNGVVNLSQPLTLNAGLQFSGGTIQNGTLFIAGSSTQSATMGVSNTTLNNSGDYELAFDASDVFVGGGSVFNNSGTLTKSTGSGTLNFNIALNNSGAVSVENGTLRLPLGGTLSGSFSALAGAVLELASNYTVADSTQFSGAGIVQLDNSTTTTFIGTITNNGTILFANTGNGVDLRLAGPVTINGNGVIALNNFSNNRIFANTAGDRFTIGSGQTIQGTGNLGIGQTTFTNNGTITANQSNPLVLQPGGGSADFINSATGILQANGGTLQLSGASGGIFTNNGAIQALGGSQVQLVNNASVVGGTLATSGSSIHSLGSSLTNVTNNGDFVLDNASTTTFIGTITNNGTILFANTGNGVDLRLAGNVTLTGSGTTTLNNFSNNRMFANTAGDRLTIGASQTIQGSGNLGIGQTTFTNNGTIIANQSTPLVLQPGGGSADFTNAAGGIMQASGGATLQLTGASGGTFINNNIIQALDGSVVEFRDGANVTGSGSFLTTGSGIIRVANSATLNNLIYVGSLNLANSSTTTLVGTLTNNGTLTFANTGNGVDLRLSGSVTLAGNGLIILNNFSNNRIFANTAGDRFTIGSGQTIQGSGNLGIGQTTFTNNGTIIANQSTPLVLQPGGGTADFVNSAGGILRADGGTLQLSGASAGMFTNNGTIEALNGSQVQLISNASVVGGTLATSGSSIHSLGSSLTNVTNNGDFVLDNASTTTFIGTITNNGTILFANTGNGIDLRLAGNVTLTGSGTTTLNNFSNNRIFANTAGDRLTIGANQTIQGSGNLGIGQTTFTNNGTITANQSTPLVLQPGGGSADFTNAAGGIMQASGGATLQLTGASGGTFVNNNIIQALDGSVVEFRDGANVTGSGSFVTSGTGLISVANSATLTNLTFVGSLSLANSSTTTLFGTLTNNGTLTFANTGNGVDLRLSGSVTLAGNGLISLNNFSNNRIFANTAGDRLTIGVGQTIQGSGNLGIGQTTFTNNGTIIANQSTPLVLQPGGGTADFVNSAGGILRADGGTLQLSGASAGIFTNNGLIEALNGSQVQLINNASVVGGTLATSGSSIHSLGSSLTDVTNNGDFVLDNSTTTTFIGAITNNGTILFANTGNGIDLRLAGNVTLTGSGTTTLNNFSNNRIFANTAGDRLTIGANQTIQGSGNLGIGQTTFTNNGTITANQSTALVIQPGGGTADFNNNATGVLRASGVGTLVLSGASGGTFANAGTIESVSGGALQFNAAVSSSGLVDVGSGSLSVTGSFSQTAGTFRVAGGTVTSSTVLDFQGGLIDARGSINAAINNNATFRPALGGSGLAVTGNVSLLSSSNLSFQLGGLTQGSQYGYLNVNGTVGLSGNLVLSFVNGFQNSVANNDTFTVLSSTTALAGAFGNVASGMRLDTSDGAGSFLVTYSGNDLVLSDYMSASLRIAKKTIALGTFRLVALNSDESGTGAKPAALASRGNGGAARLTFMRNTAAANPRSQNSSAESSSSIAQTERHNLARDNVRLNGSRLTRLGINVANSAQLLTLLDQAGPGPSGKIAIPARGVNRQAKLAGTVQAGGGRSDVSHRASNAQVNLANGTNIIDTRERHREGAAALHRESLGLQR